MTASQIDGLGGEECKNERRMPRFFTFALAFDTSHGHSTAAGHMHGRLSGSEFAGRPIHARVVPIPIPNVYEGRTS